MTPSTPLKPITMQDIADSLGLSKTAISQALTGKGRISQERRQLILDKAKELGYEPDIQARRLSRGYFENQIAIFSLDLDLGTETLKISRIQQLLMERGFDVSLHAFGFLQIKELVGAETLLRQVCRLKPRAIVCSTRDLHAPTLEILLRYQRNGGIVVCYDHPVKLACDQVVFDRAANTALAVQHLLKAGHRRIGAHPGQRNPRDRRFISPRLASFKSALKKAKVPLYDEWVFYSEHTYEEAGQDVAAQFLALPQEKRPTALYILNDHAATAFVNTVMRAGVNVPLDVSVVSDDDLPAARTCYVPLTAVSQPVQSIASAIVELLESRLINPICPPRRRVIKGRLTSRQSVSIK